MYTSNSYRSLWRDCGDQQHLCIHVRWVCDRRRDLEKAHLVHPHHPHGLYYSTQGIGIHDLLGAVNPVHQIEILSETTHLDVGWSWRIVS